MFNKTRLDAVNVCIDSEDHYNNSHVYESNRFLWVHSYGLQIQLINQILKITVNLCMMSLLKSSHAQQQNIIPSVAITMKFTIKVQLPWCYIALVICVVALCQTYPHLHLGAVWALCMQYPCMLALVLPLTLKIQKNHLNIKHNY